MISKQFWIRERQQIMAFMAILTALAFSGYVAAAPLSAADDLGIHRFDGSPEMAAEMSGLYILGFKIAMAAFHHKISHPTFPREKYFEIAGVISLQLGVELPPLPASTGDLRTSSENARYYVYGKVSPLIKEALQGRVYFREATAIFDFATYCAMAYRFYSPALEVPTGLLVEKLPELARTAKLPKLIWLGPVGMMKQGKSIPHVQAAFFEIERLILNYYGFMLDNDKNGSGPLQ